MNKEELIEELQRLRIREVVAADKVEEHVCTIAMRALNQCCYTIERLQILAKMPKEFVISPADKALLNVPYNPEF